MLIITFLKANTSINYTVFVVFLFILRPKIVMNVEYVESFVFFKIIFMLK